jgi:hypothetical protein
LLTTADFCYLNPISRSEAVFGCVFKIKKKLLAFHVCPHETTRLPLDGFSWNFIFEYFSKIVEEIQVGLKSDNGFYIMLIMHHVMILGK